MKKIICCLLLSFLLSMTAAYSGCSSEMQFDSRVKPDNVEKTGQLPAEQLPAIQLSSGKKFIPKNGTSEAAFKDLLVKHYKDVNFKKDTAILVNELTIEEIWKNSRVQIFDFGIDKVGIHGVAVVREGKILAILSGMPAAESFIADIDADGKYEVYVNTYFGSGIVSEDIEGYNIAKETAYHVSNRMKKDYKLFVEDKKLLVNEYEYPHGNSIIKSDSFPVTRALKIIGKRLEIADLRFGFAIYKIKKDAEKKLGLYLGQYVKSADGSYADELVNKVEIENKPLLTDKDIKKYVWKSNTIILNDNFLKNHPLDHKDIELINGSSKNAVDGQLNFTIYSGCKLLDCTDLEGAVIVVNGQRIYSLGFALAAWSSRFPPEIYIQDIGINSIGIHSTGELKNFVKDTRIFDFFKQEGKLEQ